VAKKNKNEETQAVAKDSYFDSAIVKKMQKEYGADFCVPLSEIKDEERGVIKTFPSLDLALNGGISMGQTAQITAKPKVGKTTLALSIGAFFQKQFPGNVFYYKVEGRLSSNMTDGIDGLDKNRFFVIQSTKDRILCGPDFLTTLENNMRNFPDCVHILDSVGSLTGTLEMSGTMEDKQMGELGAMLSKFCHRNSSVVAVTNSLLIGINQVRANINPGARGGTKSPGGFAWEHQIDTELKLSVAYPNGKITTSDGNEIGHTVDVLVQTTNLGPPKKHALLPLIYGKGIPYKLDVINLAEEFSVIEKGGAWYSFGENKWQGKQKLIDAIEEDSELFKQIEASVLELLSETS